MEILADRERTSQSNQDRENCSSHGSRTKSSHAKILPFPVLEFRFNQNVLSGPARRENILPIQNLFVNMVSCIRSATDSSRVI